MFYSTHYLSPVGPLMLGCDDKDNLVGVWMQGQKYYGETINQVMTEKDDLPIFTAAKNWLDNYFAGQKPSITDLPLAPIGGEFRRTVWDVLCEIPYGEYITYGDIAKIIAAKLGRKNMSSQAIGGAVGHNPISIIIPCHRVVGANGSLTGYAGGIGTKIKLLEHEGADMARLFIPTKGTAL